MTVYTCITAGKDTLLPILHPEPGVTYVCFTDKPFDHPVWRYAPIESWGEHPRRTARRYKVLSHLYFPGEDTIWVDGRVGLKMPPSEYTRRYVGYLCMRQHPTRTCVFKEAEVVKKQNYEHQEIVDKQMLRYQRAGYPAQNGLFETGFILRKSCPEVERFNNAWWAEISRSSARDQLSVNWVVYRQRLAVTLVDRSDVMVYSHAVPTNVNT